LNSTTRCLLSKVNYLVKSHVRAAVIGGGVVGCSVLYHLTKLGWSDVVLCERKELTAGSSWHAAGGFHALNSDPSIARLQAYTISLYEEIQRLSGQVVGLHFTGGLNIAATPERWDFLRADWARHRVLGLETELVTPEEIGKLCPIMDTSAVLGAIYDPREGHLDPYGATHAFAKAARRLGAEISLHNRVLELHPTGAGSWSVVTEHGTFEAEHVVNAAGLWAREVGQLVGVGLPLVPMEHHYLLTEDLPELITAKHEIPLVLDLDGEIYLRQERKGVLLGVYEKQATPWSLRGTPWDYAEDELLPPNLGRLEESLEKGFARFPSLANAGIRRIVNGPFTFTPDGNPLVGPVPGAPNYWAACGVMAGFAQGGGIGLALAQWMTAGEPETDIYAMDVARFGDYASASYTVEKAKEFYSRRFQIAYPNEHCPAGRPAKTSPLYDILKSGHAVMGVSFGLEVPLYFAEDQNRAAEVPSLRRSNAFLRIAGECRAAREAVALLDISSFGKYEVRGPQAATKLNRLLAGRLPAVGRLRLTPMLSPTGRLLGDLTTACIDDNQFLIFGSGYLQTWHIRWFAQHLASPGVTVTNVSDDLLGIAAFGPCSRALLARLTTENLDNAAFPFMSLKRLGIARIPALVARLSVTGELGYEIYVRAPYLRSLYQSLYGAMNGLNGRAAGMYALNSLRLEKGYGTWSREFSRDYTPSMAGLTRLIAYDKSDFIGREAALRDREASQPMRLVCLEVSAGDADASGYEPIWQAERRVGFTTSGGFGHCAQKSLALGYVETSLIDAGDSLEVSIVGVRRPCRVLTQAAIDPGGSRMRS
jgi:dimethylglycine dehydrogenase